MGYYDNNDLPFYYFMATQFAMSDHWFAPVMTNTPASRLYAMAATSRGIINKPLTQINIKTIFDELQAANVTWKDYVQDYPNGSSLKPFPAFTKYVGTNIVPFSQYADDLNAGTCRKSPLSSVTQRMDWTNTRGTGISVPERGRLR
jgi:phospholipase C